MDMTAPILSAAMQLLRRAGVRVTSGSLTELDLLLPDGEHVSVRVAAYRRPPTPHLLTALRGRHPEHRLLVVTSRTTPYLCTLADEGSVDVIAVDEDLLVFSGTRYDVPATAPEPAGPRRVRGRLPWVRWAVERLLVLSDRPRTQDELAAELGVTQQAVSHALRQHPLVRRTGGGWTADPRTRLLEGFLAEYPGPGGASTHWYGLDAPVRQAADAAAFCTERGIDVVAGGDVAADVYAPWRLPVRAVLYVPGFVDLTAAGFSPATEDTGTLTVTVPADPTLWRTAAALAAECGPAGVVDPLVALHELTHSPGPDAGEAAAHLRTAIEENTHRARD